MNRKKYKITQHGEIIISWATRTESFIITSTTCCYFLTEWWTIELDVFFILINPFCKLDFHDIVNDSRRKFSQSKTSLNQKVGWIIIFFQVLMALQSTDSCKRFNAQYFKQNSLKFQCSSSSNQICQKRFFPKPTRFDCRKWLLTTGVAEILV